MVRRKSWCIHTLFPLCRRIENAGVFFRFPVKARRPASHAQCSQWFPHCPTSPSLLLTRNHTGGFDSLHGAAGIPHDARLLQSTVQFAGSGQVRRRLEGLLPFREFLEDIEGGTARGGRRQGMSREPLVRGKRSEREVLGLTFS